MPSIDVEAKRAIGLITDIDRYRNRYVSKEANISIEFVSPSFEVFECNRFYILKNSIKRPLEQKYHFKPDYLAYDEYGTTTAWPMIMYINNISSMEDFTVPEVIIPNYGVLLNLSNFEQSYERPLDLDLLNAENSSTEEINLAIFSNSSSLA